MGLSLKVDKKFNEIWGVWIMHNDFLTAIQSKKIVEVTFSSKEEGAKVRKCIPFDYGPWRRNITPNPDRYHFYDLDSPDGKHNLSITPDQLLKIKVLEDSFNPGNYVKWTTNWFIRRDWGDYS